MSLSCEACKSHTDKPSHRCWLRSITFDSKVAMQKEAKTCWGFKRLEKEPTDEFMQPPEIIIG